MFAACRTCNVGVDCQDRSLFALFDTHVTGPPFISLTSVNASFYRLQPKHPSPIDPFARDSSPQEPNWVRHVLVGSAFAICDAEIMQSLWSRAGPSSSTCRCVSCLSTASNAVAGRTATAASRRRLWLGNSVTMFYSTIFATAMVLDVGAKTKRRNEWEKKIGEVKEEVQAMQNEEARMLDNVLSRRRGRVSASPPLSRRHYSTTAVGTAFAPPRTYQDEMQGDGISKNSSSATHEPLLSEFPLDTVGESGLESNSDSWTDDGFWVSNDPLRTRAIQRLATKQLVIRFMLRPIVASNYSGVHMGYPNNLELPKLSTDGLLDELNSIRKRINTLKKSESEIFDPLLHDISWTRSSKLREERDQLDDELHSLLFRRSNKTSSPEMLLRISDNLLATEEPISSTAMSLLIQYFVRARENDLATIVLTTLLPAKFQVSMSVIISSLNFFSKARDLQGFEGFLRRLQGFGGPVNTPKLWDTKRIGNVEVAVPPSPGHPFIYNGLICAAIKFEQFEKADAWLHVMRQTGYGGDHSVLGAYLRCYGEKGDWEKGAPFLLRAATYIMSSKAHRRGVIERLILYMLVFCQNCQKTELFSDIISAAVKSGFNWELSRNKKDTTLLFQVASNSWRNATEKSMASTAFNRTTAEKCQSFGTIIKEPIQMAINNGKKGPTVGAQELKDQRHSNMAPAALEESQMHKADLSHVEEQKQLRAEVTSLKKELSELRKLVERNNPDASEGSRLQPDSQLGQQRAAPAERLSKAKPAAGPENTTAQVENVKVPPQEPAGAGFSTYGVKASRIRGSHLSTPSSTETKPPTSRENRPSLSGARNRTKLHTRKLWPVSGPNEAESKPHFSSLAPQHKPPSSPPPSPAFKVLKVRSEQGTTPHPSNPGLLGHLPTQGSRKTLINYHLPGKSDVT